MPSKNTFLEWGEAYMALPKPVMGANKHLKASQEADMHNVMLLWGDESVFHHRQKGQMALTNVLGSVNGHYKMSWEGEVHNMTHLHHAMPQLHMTQVHREMHGFYLWVSHAFIS